MLTISTATHADDSGQIRRDHPGLRRRGTMNTPIAYTITEACSAARAGRTTLYEAIRAGVLRAVKRGRPTIILAEDLHRYLESLPAVEAGHERPPA